MRNILTGLLTMAGVPRLSGTGGLTVTSLSQLEDHALDISVMGKLRFTVEGEAADGKTDINFRNATVNVGTSDNNIHTNFDFYSGSGASGQYLRFYKPGSSTENTAAIGLNGDIHLYTVGNATNALTVGTWGGASNFIIRSDGLMGWPIPSSAPASPPDGFMWLESNTNTGLKIRINGVTKTVSLS